MISNADGPVVVGEALEKRYGAGEVAVQALRGVSVELERGTFTAIMGPSGSGKSTLMHVLAGLDRPSAGDVWLGTTKITALGEGDLTRLRRTRVGFVFQAFNLLPTLTAEENIILPTRIAGQEIDRAWLDWLLVAIGLKERRKHRPPELSGGEQQRVALARALMSRPAIVFADEPTGNLDSHAGEIVLTMLRRAADDLGQTIALVTHDPAGAARADRILFLRDGRLVHESPRLTAPQILDMQMALR
jgi:putative ABC transport system ATP-binding protein